MPAFTATATAFVNGESMAALLGTLATAGPQDPETPVGRHALTPGGVTSFNYSIVPGTLTVTPAQTAVTLTSALAKGRHTLSATYLGDGYYKGATSTFTLTVD